MRKQNVMRILALVIVMVMMFSVASCDFLSNKEQSTTAPATEATTPKATDPVTDPATDPATEPEATEPEATEPVVTEPVVTEPVVTEPEVTEPEVTEPESVPGESAENPIYIYDLTWTDDQSEATATVTAPAGTTYYAVYGVAGMYLSINGGEATLVEGGNPRMPAIITITTEGENTLKFTWPVGVMNNPADLVIGENSATLAAGSQGYYYTWTATANGTLTITINGTNWTYVVNNLTSGIYGDTQWSDSDPLVATTTIAVVAGDEIQIMVNTYNPEDMWAAPAGTITFTAAFAEAVACEHKWANATCVAPKTCTVCGATEGEVGTAHSYEDFTDRFAKKWGVCTLCNHVDDNHEHAVVNGKCAYCEYVYEVVEVPSSFSNDGDETPDIFYFSAALPEEFTGEDVIHLDAFNDATGNHMDWDEMRTQYIPGKVPYPHVYNADQVATDSIVFTFNAPKAGLYNVAVHYRIKDAKIRGAKFFVNDDTVGINHTYGGWEVTEEVRNNDYLIGAYMTGLTFALKEGENTITIKVADGIEKSQHFRDLFLVWSADLPAGGEEEPETLTAEEAIALGNTFEKTDAGKGKYYLTEEFYYVTLTLNTQANANGFARATLEGVDMIISVAGGYLTGDAEGSIIKGDTIRFLAQIGCVNSASTSSTKEARLFNVKSWEYVEKAPRTLTAEEAITLGNTFEKTDAGKGKYYLTEEFYYVTLTLNTQANANGFARATLEGVDMIISVAAPAGYVEGTYKQGDTVTFLAQIGCVNSASTASTKEARLFNATVVEVVPAAPAQ